MMAATIQPTTQTVKPGAAKPWAWPGTGMQGDTAKPIGAPGAGGDRGAASGWNGGASGDFAGGSERYASLAATMAGLNGGPKPVSAWPGAPGDTMKPMGAPSMGSATAGPDAMLKNLPPPGNDALVPPGMQLAPGIAPSASQSYSGRVFTPGQTLTTDDLPEYQAWLAAGRPGQSAPPAQAPGASAPQAGQSFGPQGFGSNVVNDPNSPLRGLPGIDNTTVDYATLPGLEEDFSGMGDRVRSALFQRTSGLLNPEHERAREATAQRLANSGIPEGSERWNEEMDRLDQQRSLSLERAGLDADVAAGDEMGRLFQMALARRQQLGGERERGADRAYSQTLGTRAQFAGERLGQAGIDANIAAANAQAGATASGHALQAAQAAAANDIARGRLGLDADEQAFTQWLRSGQFAREGVNMPNFGTPIPLDVTGAAGVAQSGANARASNDAAARAGYWGLAGTLLNGAFGKKGYQ